MATKFFNADTDSTLSANSNYRVPSQKAVKTYVDGKLISADGTTIENNSGTITAIGVKTKNNVTKYDWIGTYNDWLAGRNAGTIPDSWVCYITDDYVNSSAIVLSATSDFDLYAPTDMYTIVHTDAGVTLNAPQNITADWIVCYMQTGTIKVQMATRVDNPAVQFTRTYKTSTSAWTDWTMVYGAYYPGA